MGFVIVTRNPNGRKLIAVVENTENECESTMAEFPTEDEAIRAARNVICCQAWGYQIVEVDE